jgi:hypothetical protein
VTIGKFAVCTLSALVVAALPATGAAARTADPAPGTDFRHACSAAPPPGWAQCLVLVRTGLPSLRGLALGITPAGYGPAELQGAYHLALAAAAAGRGETVAVVDAYDDPDAAADLATYRAHYGLPACGAGCFSQVNQAGEARPRPAVSGSTGWATEESLDVDMVSAICPNCHILLVEADNSSLASLGQAVNAAVALGARFVSNSYSAAEFSGETAADSAYYDHPGVAVTAAAGDSGYGVGYPAASGYVTSVGGTELTRTPGAARGWSETAWNSGSGATGSGCSAYEPKPSWQADAGCSHRTDNDVAADADPDTGAAIYDSYDQGGWLEVGGTSEATPIIAATYALAGPPGAGSDPAEYPYQHTAALNDVTSGRDGSCGGSYLCTARPGYDGPTGWGTPDGTGAFQAVGHSVTVASPGNRLTRAGMRVTPLAIAARDSSPAWPLWYTASGLPAGLSISPGGIISGTPRARGYYAVRVYATDNAGVTGSVSFGWAVESVGVVTALGQCLDDWHVGTANGNKIDIYRCNGGRAQAWLAYPRPGGVLQIRLARAAGRCLTAPNATGRARLWRCGAAGQRWRTGAHGHLVSLRSGLCLADPRTGPSGTWLEVSRCADTAAEHWTLR